MGVSVQVCHTYCMNNIEEAQLVELLKKLEPGFLPFDVFVQMTRLMVTTAIELIVLRKNNAGSIEVLLLPRNNDFEYWIGKVHVPGVVLRPGDSEGDLDVPFRRIINEELEGLSVSKPVHVMTQYRKSARGSEAGQLYMAVAQEDPKVGAFYEATELPENMIEDYKAPIARAVELFHKMSDADH